MSKIRPEELDERRSRGDDLVILDVRPREDYQAGHIDGSQNAPVYRDLAKGDTEALEAHLDEIPTGAEVVTVCKKGVVARKATSYLSERGREAATLAGGMWGWRQYENGTLLYRLSSWVRNFLG
ncbi:rhodanese-like domain-containing protein [Halorussus amylolyticus]|uniref:rhodanese-like domain-containing protein n=1 Tax=Halorussus amylolyticus TaxID=1126242 RepID=UPI00138F3A5F|nr:rhodanese-like domain-containing protein [Halorussus amylolyticus]